MKPNTTLHAFNLTTASEVKTMGIDVHSTAHIIGLLTDLYSDQELAVIREYSTNAADSHSQSGQTRPIEVSFPVDNQLDAQFVVQDWGLGLSKDDITEVYSMYGASTKRDTNDATGMLGLGSKSGLTYAVSFTVDATKDGWRTIATVTRGETGVGEIQILLHQETDGPNGVKITIPVENGFSFGQKATDFFFYWRDGNVLTNGEAPLTIDDDEEWTQIDPDVYTKAYNGYRNSGVSKIVMGGVPYPLEKEVYPRTAVVAFVPIGAVDFVPAREALLFNDLTEEVVDDICDFVTVQVFRKFEEEADACLTDWERLKLIKRWSNSMSNVMRARIEGERKRFRNFLGGHGWSVRYYDQGRGMDLTQVNRTKMEYFQEDWVEQEGTVFVRNFDLKAFTNQHFERVRATGFTHDRYIVLPESYSKFVATASFPGIDWKKVPQLPRAKKAASGTPTVRKAKTSYECYINNTFSSQTDFATTDLNVCYEVSSNRSNYRKSWEGRRFFGIYPTTTLVLITPKQENKFKRLFPHVPTISEWVERRKNAVQAKITPDIRAAMLADSEVVEFSRRMKPHVANIANQDFLDMLFTYEVPDELQREINHHGIDLEHPDNPPVIEQHQLIGKWPLLEELFGYARHRYFENDLYMKHTIAYLNAVSTTSTQGGSAT